MINGIKQMTKVNIFIMLVVITVVSGCATTDPFTGEKKMTNATQGSLWGAFGGALLAAAVSDKKDRKKRMLQGAGIGALGGAAVGHYMDRQENELRQQLQGSGVSVTRDGDNIILNMPSNITFDTDSFRLKSQFQNTLDSVVLVLNEYKSTMINVVGHTDSTGSKEYNQNLSVQRALSVANYLSNKGVIEQRLAASGYGEAFPIAPNNTEAGRAQNRRVEVELQPVTQ